MTLSATLVSSDDQIIEATRDAPYTLDLKADLEELLELPSTADLLILDLENIENLEQICRSLKQTDQSSPYIVLVTPAEYSKEQWLQAYELGVDECLSKPLSPEVFTAKLRLFASYAERTKELQKGFQQAQQVAMEALTTTSEFGRVMQFVEKSYAINNIEDLAEAFFALSSHFSLNCTLMVENNQGIQLFFSSTGNVAPLESQVLQLAKSRSAKRFHDFNLRTLINFDNLSLLVKNMPLDDPNLYGRMKDLLPVVLGAMDSKIASLKTEDFLKSQAEDLGSAFDVVKESFLHLSKLVHENMHEGNRQMTGVLHDLCHHLPGMGLEDDQESFILNKVEKAVGASVQHLDMREEINQVFNEVHDSLHILVAKQNQLLNLLVARQKLANEERADAVTPESDIELF